MYKSKINSSIGSNAKPGNELTCGKCAVVCVDSCNTSCDMECSSSCYYTCTGGCYRSCRDICTYECSLNCATGVGPLALPKK